jgi:hypothetical protein
LNTVHPLNVFTIFVNPVVVQLSIEAFPTIDEQSSKQFAKEVPIVGESVAVKSKFEQPLIAAVPNVQSPQVAMLINLSN